MNSINVNQFRENLKEFVKQVVNQHIPLKVIGGDGEDFVIVSAEDWEQDQETLYVLQNRSLMLQIAESMTTHEQGKGYVPTDEELDEIISI